MNQFLNRIVNNFVNGIDIAKRLAFITPDERGTVNVKFQVQ